jgi:hypothetical protein
MYDVVSRSDFIVEEYGLRLILSIARIVSAIYAINSNFAELIYGDSIGRFIKQTESFFNLLRANRLAKTRDQITWPCFTETLTCS